MGIWGQPLPNVVLTTKRAIPNFLEKAFDFILTKKIDEEGIFRIPGDKKSKDKMKAFVDATDDIEITDSTNMHDVCNTITAFISAIPKHIFIDDNVKRVLLIKTKEDAKAFIDSLPYINRVLASRVFGFFSLIAKHSDKNKMSASNIAVILSPILIDDPSNSTFILDNEIILHFLVSYSFVFSFNPSIDESGNWIPADKFKAPIDDVMEQFFCQSSLGNPSLKPTSHEKEMKMCRKIQIEDKAIDDLLDELLVGNSVSRSNKKQIITPL